LDVPLKDASDVLSGVHFSGFNPCFIGCSS